MLIVGKTREGKFLLLFVIQIASYLGLLVYHTFFKANMGILAGILNVVQDMAPAVIVTVSSTIVIVEGGEMLAERYLRRRYSEGKHEGQVEMQEEWEAWNKRRKEAEAKGESFTEPPPSPKPEKNKPD